MDAASLECFCLSSVFVDWWRRLSLCTFNVYFYIILFRNKIKELNIKLFKVHGGIEVLLRLAAI